MFDHNASLTIAVALLCTYLCIIPQLAMCMVDSKPPQKVTLAPDSLAEVTKSFKSGSSSSNSGRRGAITFTDTDQEIEIENHNLITETVYDFPKKNSRFMAVISFNSWNQYLDFAKSTCRDDEIKKIMEDPPNYMESGYFSWEENLFHQQLRKWVFRDDFFPETAKGNYTEWLRNPLSKELDARLLMPPPKSFCPSEEDLEEDIEIEQGLIEKNVFEDTILNRVFQFHQPVDSKLYEIYET